jgi:transaldolase/glucose-6-phosphate isomerase
VPVAGEPPGEPEEYREDRVFVRLTVAGEPDGPEDELLRQLEARGHPVVRIRLEEIADLGREFYRWEMATAAAGAVLGVNPFNQPDVQLAKTRALEAMERGNGRAAAGDYDREAEVLASRPGELARELQALLSSARDGDYVAVQAYVPPRAVAAEGLEECRSALRRRLRLATTLGFGPRFLHSTGQLHKGGANNGLFLQLVDAPANDLAVPETNFTFGELIRAQALGDYRALKERGRRVLRVNLEGDVPRALEELARALETM